MAGTLAIGDEAHTGATIGSGLTTVAAGASLGGYGTVAGSVNNSGTVAAANALASFASGNTGTFRIGGDLNNAGIVNLAAASGRIGNVLNVAGNYTGANGQIVLNTLLNEGGAASQSDRLVVGGNVGGTTAIKVNQSGLGALTVGNGIQLVQVNGTSAANSFHLAGPVQAGAYQIHAVSGRFGRSKRLVPAIPTKRRRRRRTADRPHYPAHEPHWPDNATCGPERPRLRPPAPPVRRYRPTNPTGPTTPPRRMAPRHLRADRLSAGSSRLLPHAAA